MRESGVAETALKVSETRHNSKTKLFFANFTNVNPRKSGEKPIEPVTYTFISTVEQL